MMLDEARETAKELADGFLDNRDIAELPLDIGYEGENTPAVSIDDTDRGEVVLLNLDQVDSPTETEVLSAASSGIWDSQGGIYTPDQANDVDLVGGKVTEEEIQEIDEYFEEYLPGRERELIRRCMYLRRKWESDESYTEKSEMDRRKSDLRKAYGDKAGVVANLASSGYYDTDGYMRTIFRRMADNDSSGPTDYLQTYEKMLRHEPFCMFVSGWDRIPDIKSALENKLKSSDMYSVPVDFVDVRGQGGNARSKMEQAVLDVQREADRIHFEAQVRPRETVYRIYPDEVEGLF